MITIRKAARLRRAIHTRYRLQKLHAIRLVVHRTNCHTYAQIIASDNADVLVSASTVEKIIRKKLNSTSNKEAAATIGKIVAERALKKGIKKVSFDRSGFQYHGRIRMLADAARKAGLQF
ncbi:50S ribosomal protein L18 [Sodalis sp. CWE]|uniref:50S ribosomal protein L18 n=1 Tax=Sodalis sp. CWE TaxID=2803816 RepID=UPI001C7D9AA0|nr:50S ribosomal protein L18 [Sodalis sp. CWE]MBX4180756.1 50S ribosomal protein L18 [Sodalis sp. CWE]